MHNCPFNYVRLLNENFPFIDMGRFADSLTQEMIVEYGEAAILNVPPIDSYPKPAVAWEHDHDLIMGGEQYITEIPDKLVILSVSKEHEGSYRYELVRVLGSGKKDKFLIDVSILELTLSIRKSAKKRIHLISGLWSAILIHLEK